MDDLKVPERIDCPVCFGDPVIYWKSFPEHEQQPSLHLRADCVDCGTYIKIVDRSYARFAVNTKENPIVGRGMKLPTNRANRR